MQFAGAPSAQRFGNEQHEACLEKRRGNVEVEVKARRNAAAAPAKERRAAPPHCKRPRRERRFVQIQLRRAPRSGRHGERDSAWQWHRAAAAEG
jgi:hypothetical protein